MIPPLSVVQRLKALPVPFEECEVVQATPREVDILHNGQRLTTLPAFWKEGRRTKRIDYEAIKLFLKGESEAHKQAARLEEVLFA